MKKLTTYDLTLCAFFAALTAALSQLAIPIGPVPINLALFSVFCCGALLGSYRATFSQGAYVLLGLIGLPVFAKFNSGPGALAGPTGGYIVGYVAASCLIGFLTPKRKSKPLATALAITAGYILCMAIGTCWYAYSTNSKFFAAMLACVIPFLPMDTVKILLAANVSIRLRPVLLGRRGAKSDSTTLIKEAAKNETQGNA